MSYWVYLLDETKAPVEVSPFTDGGTYQVGGTSEAELNVTYNYGSHYYTHLSADEGLRWLHGKTAENTIGALEYAISQLSDETDPDYWKSTEGNAKRPLVRFLAWAKQHPKATWEVH